MKIKCACGQTYDDKNLTKHLNSKHHQELLKKDITKIQQKQKSNIKRIRREQIS